MEPVSKKKKKNDQLNEVLTLMKNFADNDPTERIINFLPTEMEKSRDHELRIMQAMFSSPCNSIWSWTTNSILPTANILPASNTIPTKNTVPSANT